MNVTAKMMPAEIPSAIGPSFVLVDALGILSNVEEVERLVVDFSIAKSWIKQIMGLNTQTLCDISIEMKLYLCQLYFKEDVYDFDYSWPSNLKNEALKCAYEDYSLRILDEKLLKSSSRLMYECPSTNEGEFLGQRNLTYIARSRIENSALVFTRRNRSSPLYPHRYIDGFTFQQLEEEMSTSTLQFGYSILREPSLRMIFSNLPSTHELSLPVSPLRILERQLTTEGHVYQSVKNRQLEMYEKFRKFYKIVPVCSLTNIEKLIFCELVRNKTFVNDIDFEFDEKQLFRCERRTISYNTKSDTKGLEEKAIPLIRCPVVVIAGEDDSYGKIRMIYSPHQVFISNCFEANCLVVYRKRTHQGDTKPKVNTIHADFPIKAILAESKAINRKLIYSAKELQKTRKPGPTSLARYKYKLTDYRPAYQLDQSLSRTEKEVMNLFEIVNLTSPFAENGFYIKPAVGKKIFVIGYEWYGCMAITRALSSTSATYHSFCGCSLGSSKSNFRKDLTDRVENRTTFSSFCARISQTITEIFKAYERFGKTLKKFNLCAQSRKKKIEYCVLTYENQLYKYKIDRNDKSNNMRCQRSEILLNDFEGKQNLALVRCPIVELEVFEGQYLSAGVEERTIIMYSRSTTYGTTYPTALAPQIPLKESED